MIATVILYPSATLVAVLVGIVLPLITGLVTKLNADSAVKVAANAVLSVVTAAVVGLAGSPQDGLDLYAFLYALAFAFVSSIASYAGIWKPLGVTTKIQQSTARFGLGQDAPADS